MDALVVPASIAVSRSGFVDVLADGIYLFAQYHFRAISFNLGGGYGGGGGGGGTFHRTQIV